DTPFGASVVPSVNAWVSRGCYRCSPFFIHLHHYNFLNNHCSLKRFDVFPHPRRHACNQACVGNNTEVCGGPNALQVYM
ncbi:hypothetical protein B0F90DRAFT_1725914, partial [Multifurca ochricompacta]